jgi:hypothetical protein
MNPIAWLVARRKAKKEERREIAAAQQGLRRAGDEPGKTMAETVENAAGEFPPLG